MKKLVKLPEALKNLHVITILIILTVAAVLGICILYPPMMFVFMTLALIGGMYNIIYTALKEKNPW